MIEQTVFTCSNCGGASSRVTVFADGYTLCVICKRKQQDAYERTTGYRPQPATEADEELRRLTQ